MRLPTARGQQPVKTHDLTNQVINMSGMVWTTSIFVSTLVVLCMYDNKEDFHIKKLAFNESS